jgi:hypothetical protein
VTHATRPRVAGAGKRGRPRKPTAGTKEPGCVWPLEESPDGTCGRPPVESLALCPAHAQVLEKTIGRGCAWPGCEQTNIFRSTCGYHSKVAAGLLDPYRS